MKLLRVGPLAIVLIVVSASVARLGADEGFWPFNAVPKAAIKKAHGFSVTDQWLDHLRLASVKFGSASGSFVSADGLVLTNHHVGLNTISKLSTPDRDLVKDGFYARTRAEELKAPDLELNVLAGIEDVTARVNAAAKDGQSQAEAYAARKAAMVTIEQESTSATGLKSEVVTLYQGALYHLYRYKKYTDVRLVFAPEFDIAFFGGDPDNFTYPRYCLDVSIFRVYENDRPATTEHFLKWSPQGAKAGELVFTSGNPGATQRLNTVAHLTYLRDTGVPFGLWMLEQRQAVLKAYGARGDEQTRQVKDDLFGVENSLKSYRGQLAGLKDPALMGKKTAAEAALRGAVDRNATLKKKFGGAWDQIAAARQGLPAYFKEQTLIEGGAGFYSRYFNMARAIVRLADESAKPDTERLPEYTEARRSTLERQLFSPAPFYPEAEQAKFAGSLTLLTQTLGPEHPVVKKALDGQTPDARAAAMVQASTLADIDVRKAFVKGGREAVAASDDPFIVLARTVDGEARAIRKRYEDQVMSVERDAYAKIAQAVFATEGSKAYPDATSTLRLSYGVVKGYEEDGKAVPPFTVMAGLFERAEKFGNAAPYDTPQRWDDRKASLDLRTPFNQVTTNDIVGGNSGSPIVNRNGELVGLVFDGNIQSLPGYFIYDAAVNRTVAVDSRGVLEALRKVYDAGPLVDEILGKPVEATAASR
jgi:Peptidase S46